MYHHKKKVMLQGIPWWTAPHLILGKRWTSKSTTSNNMIPSRAVEGTWIHVCVCIWGGGFSLKTACTWYEITCLMLSYPLIVPACIWTSLYSLNTKQRHFQSPRTNKCLRLKISTYCLKRTVNYFQEMSNVFRTALAFSSHPNSEQGF